MLLICHAFPVNVKHNLFTRTINSSVKSWLPVQRSLLSTVTYSSRQLGTVYTDAVSFVTASVSMRLRLSFTRRRSSSLSEPGRFENAFKSGAFSKRYGFIGRVNGETASI